jgi:hypothetical protein
MIRALTLGFAIASLPACHSVLDTVERDNSFCDAVMPPLTPWDGNRFPLQTEIAALYLYDSPTDTGNLWAIVVDGDQVTMKADIKPPMFPALGTHLLESCNQASAAAAGDDLSDSCVEMPVVVKGNTPKQPKRQRGGAQVAPLGPDNAPYLIYRTHALYDANLRAAEDFASGKVCPQTAAP